MLSGSSGGLFTSAVFRWGIIVLRLLTATLRRRACGNSTLKWRDCWPGWYKGFSWVKEPPPPGRMINRFLYPAHPPSPAEHLCNYFLLSISPSTISSPPWRAPVPRQGRPPRANTSSTPPASRHRPLPATAAESSNVGGDCANEDGGVGGERARGSGARSVFRARVVAGVSSHSSGLLLTWGEGLREGGSEGKEGDERGGGTA